MSFQVNTPTIRIDGEIIAGIKSGSMSYGRNMVDITALGDLAEMVLPGITRCTFNLNILLDPDSTEHDTLWDAMQDKTKLTTLYVYYDATAYIQVDTAADANAGMYVESFPMEGLEPDGVVMVPLVLRVSGPIKKSTD